ncbi:MAG: helix-turn-helix domain-containing protein, partial [Lachnospiraceae bacterium]|nr:helix-turn-helix domain-containing protein [Lachnospiraceae bacterium]
FLELFSTGRDIVYYSLTKQEYDTVRRHFFSIEYEINAQPDNFWILRTRYFIQSILFMATADFYRNFRQDDIYDDPLVAKVTRYFWEHIDEDITLDSILKVFSVNKNYLNDAFNKEVSMSCMAYLEQLRINLAKSELQYGNHTISEISVGVGYSDTNYFSKVFKKHTGMTPSEYLKQMRGLC